MVPVIEKYCKRDRLLVGNHRALARFTAFWFTFTRSPMSLAKAFSPALRELRILFSQTGDASQGVK